jgi:capsule biosynthesis phosphatase
MIIIIPLGGTGERFKQHGYTTPKAFINIFGKPILYYLLDNLVITKNIKYIYIPYNKEYSEYRIEDTLQKDYPTLNFTFLKLENQTKGSAQTINIALSKIHEPDCPVLCLDGDNFYNIDIIKLWDSKNFICTFNDLSESPVPMYSYIYVENDNVLQIKEKNKISNLACTGAYGFSSYKSLLSFTQKIIDNDITQNNEFYMSGVIDEMLQNNMQFYYEIINKTDYVCLGTPIQVLQFYNNFPKVSCKDNTTKIQQKRFCFDLDNTLVTYPLVKDDYTTVQPIQKNIDFLNYIKSFGNEIIIYTARRMKTHHGNTGKVYADIGKITFDTLEKFNIYYDEIYFGKPYAHFYIDDNAINCFGNIEKLCGYYQNNILLRSFNTLELQSIETYTKKSKNLSGEIHYYKNIPHTLKDLFPLFINSVSTTEYTIEKIQGIILSDIYTNEILNESILINVLNSIKRIHHTKIHENITIDIYGNYTKKLKTRYHSFDYSMFKNSESIFNDMYTKLHEYESLDKGKIGIIHGDPVFTNIILNTNNKIKCIDMRGEINNDLTIYGDTMYDWAKIYQSLIGYDKILKNKILHAEYEQKMIHLFEEYFTNLYSSEYFGYLKTITKSLLFSLIPLHDEKTTHFYNLISINYLE